MTFTIPRWVLIVLGVVVVAGVVVGATLLLTGNHNSTTTVAASTTTASNEPSGSLTALEDAYLNCAKKYEVWTSPGHEGDPKPRCVLSRPLDPGPLDPGATVNRVLSTGDKALSTQVPSENQTVAAYLSEMVAIRQETSGYFRNLNPYRRLLNTLPP